MKKTIAAICSICFLIIGTSVIAQSNNSTKPTTTRDTPSNSTKILKAFFTAFGKGDIESIINAFHDVSTITSVREGDHSGKEIYYGTYKGKEGVKSLYYKPR